MSAFDWSRARVYLVPPPPSPWRAPGYSIRNVSTAVGVAVSIAMNVVNVIFMDGALFWVFGLLPLMMLLWFLDYRFLWRARMYPRMRNWEIPKEFKPWLLGTWNDKVFPWRAVVFAPAAVQAVATAVTFAYAVDDTIFARRIMSVFYALRIDRQMSVDEATRFAYALRSAAGIAGYQAYVNEILRYIKNGVCTPDEVIQMLEATNSLPQTRTALWNRLPVEFAVAMG